MLLCLRSVLELFLFRLESFFSYPENDSEQVFPVIGFDATLNP